jgi:hypothetical protein
LLIDFVFLFFGILKLAAQKIEEAQSRETLVNFYHTLRRHNTEHDIPGRQGYEKHKSHKQLKFASVLQRHATFGTRSQTTSV